MRILKFPGLKRRDNAVSPALRSAINDLGLSCYLLEEAVRAHPEEAKAMGLDAVAVAAREAHNKGLDAVLDVEEGG